MDFVNGATDESGANYVPVDDRVAVFDNDGTLWSEQPTYFQIEFIFHRIRLLAPQHPKWEKDKLMQAAINHDLETLRQKYGAEGLGKLMAIAQAGVTTDEFEAVVREWIQTAKHPTTGRLVSRIVFQPMLELIEYLKNKDFRVYIVSGGGLDFMRAWAEEVYGIPRENVLGSLPKYKFERVDDKPVLMKIPEILFVNDQEGKPMTIHYAIGKKPLIAFGNSDGDLQMLEWCDARDGKSLPAYIHHTDSKREWAYDRDSRIGTLNKGLDAAAEHGWLVVDMKKDWKVIYPGERNEN